MKLSKHSKMRMFERANIDIRNQKLFFRNALSKGLSAGHLKEGALKQYLLNKEKYNCKAKFYKGYIFIYSKNNKQLYTMYPVPEELLQKKE